MGKDTLIQWCDSTVNGTTGCDGCELWSAIQRPYPEVVAERKPVRICYAGVLHEGRLAKSLPKLYAPSFTEVRLAPGRMAEAAGWSDLTGKARPGKPWLDGMPRVIFVGDMGDVLSKGVPFEYLESEVIANVVSPKGRRHVWMLLTKQARRLAEFSDWLAEKGVAWPENLWAGVSVTGPKTLRRIDGLHRTNATVKFVSFEPLVEDVGAVLSIVAGRFHLAIIGGESDQGEHRGRPFDVGWCRDLIGQCRGAGVSAFVKQLGADPFLTVGDSAGAVVLQDSHGGDWSEWPEDLRVRQMPEPAGVRP